MHPYFDVLCYFTHMSSGFFFCHLFIGSRTVEVVCKCTGNVGGCVNEGWAQIFITVHYEDIGAEGEV